MITHTYSLVNSVDIYVVSSSLSIFTNHANIYYLQLGTIIPVFSKGFSKSILKTCYFSLFMQL